MAYLGKYQAPDEINRWRTICLGIGGIGLLAWGVGAYLTPEEAFSGWLLGFIFWSGIGIGSLGLLMLQYLTGGAWGIVIRRPAEAASRTLVLVFLLFIPIAVGVYTRNFYEWTHLTLADPVMEHRGVFMAPWFWILRGFLYIGLLWVMATLLNKWLAEQDRSTTFDAAAGLLERCSRFSGPTLVIYALVVTFAVVDWIMTLDPHWFSTIWGLLYVIGWALSSLCFSVTLLAYLSTRAPMDHVVGKRHFHDLGKLMLAMVMVWAYFNFSQFLIIWSGNLPEETTWFLIRMKGAWGYMGVILIVFHFAVPFLILLQQDFKRRAKWLAGVAVFMMFMRIVDVFYQIGPTIRVNPGNIVQNSFHISWLDLVGPVAIGGIWLWFFFGELMKRPLVPINDPYLEEAIEHGHGH